eukprot:TRINITY_DN4347_c0_g2_i1.p1 TRINITY_DN4347_c0_g2~~TRINITY_DN4347_c0_g2_i1.p1  ORF type:complete len:222 (+),score=47.52 TRINITY_DN4347_c0_g2_i1:144-809(+)
MQPLKRLQKELEKMRVDPVVGIQAEPCGDNMLRWKARIQGPEGSPYEGGCFELDIDMSSRYPLEPPKVKFRTPIFHPNVSGRGDICLDVLKSQWSPALSLQKVLLSLSSLLTDPNFADPLNAVASSLYSKNRSSYDAKCREMTRQHAMSAGKSASEPQNDKKRKLETYSEEDLACSQESSPGNRTAQAKAKAKAKAKAAVKAKAKAKEKAKAKAKAKSRSA